MFEVQLLFKIFFKNTPLKWFGYIDLKLFTKVKIKNKDIPQEKNYEY
tara:strand:- start:71 stop:211 length:141 start_codon:yes stop_codon:yes gene_type:complete